MTPPQRGSKPAEITAFLELHHYSGGLRFLPLGVNGQRPDWAPPADWVGYRDEIPLLAGDYIVEASRILFAGRHCLWIGVYGSSADSVFGPRQNHVGIGAWLLEQEVVEARALLAGLRGMLDVAGSDDTDRLDREAGKFLAPAFLPKYVRSIAELPPPFSGWAHAGSPITETAIFGADDPADEGEWHRVAEQLLRMQVIEGPSSQHSRVLILLRNGAKRLKDGGDLVSLPARGHLLREILGQLPTALSDLASQYDAVGRELASARRGASQAQGQLRDVQTAVTSLQAENNTLHTEVRALKSAKEKDPIQRRLDKIDQSLDAINRTLKNPPRHGGGHAPPPPPPPPPPPGNGGGNLLAAPHRLLGISPGAFWAGIALLALIAAVVAAVWRSGDAPRPTPPSTETPAERTATSVSTPVGQVIGCKPSGLSQDDGTITCAEGQQVTLAGIATRHTLDPAESCGSERACPVASAAESRKLLLALLGARSGNTGDDFTGARPLACTVESVPPDGSIYTAWCTNEAGKDLSCLMVTSQKALKTGPSWRNHRCPAP